MELEVGTRVVGLPDFKWFSDDRTTCQVGTVTDIDRPGTNTFLVRWDSGKSSSYKTGKQEMSELRVFDHAPTGRESRVTCSSCKAGVEGVVWKCSECEEITLCCPCYHGDEHNVNHVFYRIDGRAKWKEVKKRSDSTKVEVVGFLKNSTVVRGPDWCWDDQDGCEGATGVILAIENSGSVAQVKWGSGVTNKYSIYHNGNVDLKVHTGTLCYQEHLALFDTTERQESCSLNMQECTREDERSVHSDTLPPAECTTGLSAPGSIHMQREPQEETKPKKQSKWVTLLTLCKSNSFCVIIELFSSMCMVIAKSLFEVCGPFAACCGRLSQYFKIDIGESFRQKQHDLLKTLMRSFIDTGDTSDEEYERKMAELNMTHASLVNTEFGFVCKWGYDKHMETVLKHWKPLETNGKFTCLDLAMYSGNHNIAKQILDMEGNSKVICHKGKYNATCLHLAILQDQTDVVKSCLESLKKQDVDLIYEFLHCEADRKLAQNLYGTTSIRATLPLNMAVVTGNEEIINTLFQYGVELDKQDSYGYSVLHSIVSMSSLMPEKAVKMYNYMFNNHLVPWWTQKLEAKNLNPNVYTQMEAAYYILNLKTKDRLTPLVLATKYGCRMMVERIIDTEYVYKFTVMKGCTPDRCIAYYDTAGIETPTDEKDPSPVVLEVLLNSQCEKSIECLQVPLIDDILAAKWNKYFFHYVWLALAYFLYLGMLTGTMFTVSLPETDVGNDTLALITSNRMDDDDLYLLLLYVFVGAFMILFVFLPNFIYLVCLLLTGRIGPSRDFGVVFFCVFFSIMVITRYILHELGHPLQIVFFGISVVLGWSFAVFFLNGFKPTATFSVVIETLLFKDFLLFGVCYFFITCGFSAAITANMNSTREPHQFFAEWKYTFFSLFRINLGLIEPDNYKMFDRKTLPRQVYTFNIYLIVAYVIITTIVLFNILIASMTNSYKIIQSQKELFWKQQRCRNIRLFEKYITNMRSVLKLCERPPKYFYNIRTICRNDPDTNCRSQNSVRPISETTKSDYCIKTVKRVVCWHKMKTLKDI